MTIQCPKCGSDQVQSVRAILHSGTTFTTGSVSGVGVGTNGAGTFAGTGSSTSQTTLAARFSPPKKPSKLEVIGGTVLGLATSPFLFSGSPLAFLSLAILAWLAWEVRAYMKRDKKYKNEYPMWKNLHDHGFYCHRCASTFLVNS